ncbi:ATP-binding protein [Geobacter sp. AOG1]|uniref:ATP-binding protein n=1 Tax=Geobacter sp. AOG1 TaxID=1566346 RepID=UPI001CC70C8E|nr:ATP-binding protein [Geobacter sp. AOG1]GFE58849.1 ATPase [Geobacter sp. AOG1]
MPEQWETVIGKLERFLAKAEVLMDRYGVPEPLDEALFASCQAFRWEGRGESGRLVPVRHPHLVDLDDLVGVDMAKTELVRNTAQFVAGKPANNVLLWGERGTGKSSCVKGLLQLFAAHGLRLIEVERGELLSLPRISSLIRGVPYRFIIFCDDLSFAAGDASYQELKTLLDGGIEARPGNMLIYATSNRRHLMPEPMADNLREEIHPEDAVADKLSLADRFGLTLSFYPFSQETYLAVVEHHADLLGLSIDRDDLRREALRWALYKGQRSGRAARQFIDDLAGRLDA